MVNETDAFYESAREVIEMNVQKWLRKSTLIGLGIVSMTKTKAEKLAKEMVKQGHINEKEGRKLATRILKETRKQSAKLQKTIDAQLKKALKK